MALARHHRRIANQRRDALHKVTTKLSKTTSVIVIEDLHTAGLIRNRHVARHISDQGWAEFQSQLAYKATWYGGKLLLAPRFYPSSRICSNCGAVRAKLRLNEPRSTRPHVAASSAETGNACGDGSAGGIGNDPVNLPSPKQEPAASRLCWEA
jgi:IS605 OrfB family transposase